MDQPGDSSASGSSRQTWSSNGCFRRRHNRRQKKISRDGECSVCISSLSESPVTGFRVVAENTENDLLRETLREFFSTINALMNDCGGMVCLHFCQPCSLSVLDKVDERLSDLIANNTTFEKNFERHQADQTHVVYRVKPADYPCISVLDFNSPLSVNRGLFVPTQGQMQVMMQRAFYGLSTSEEDRNTCNQSNSVSGLSFSEGQTVSLKPFCTIFLQEVNLAAIEISAGETFGVKLVNYCWTQLELSKCIAAFCKYQSGGSVYLGIAKETLPPSKAWKPVDCLELKEVFQTKLRLWQDVEPQVGRRVFYLAADEDVPQAEERSTGRYICQGIRLSVRDRSAFEAHLHDRLQTDMLWHPQYPSDDHPVTVCFHPVQSSNRDLCVVEVKVSRFQGVAFHSPHGPEIYKIRMNRGRPEVAILPFAEYTKRQTEQFLSQPVQV